MSKLTDSNTKSNLTLSKKALQGTAGVFVERVSPHTESSEAALLFQFLAAAGNVFDRKSYYLHEATRHYANLFVILVGKTAKARKGTSWNHIEALMKQVDPCWTSNCIDSGMSSGEGLIERVKDPRTEEIDGEEKIVAPGISDKRLLVLESEFASVLRMNDRAGNILSAQIRNAWDGRKLSVLTRQKNRLIATNPHISIVGHITQTELMQCLNEVQSSNGFANRFLWVHVYRSKLLPEGGTLSQDQVSVFVKELKICKDRLSEEKRFQFSKSGREYWHALYKDLSKSQKGIMEFIASRSEPQVIRLALTYAILDRSEQIEVQHLEAALAAWRYCEDSCWTIFGKATSNPVTETILSALRRNPDDGLSRTDISYLFNRNVPSIKIERALNSLFEEGLAYHRTAENGVGRREERWIAFPQQANEINELNERSQSDST